MELLYKPEHFSCHNYEKGQNSSLEILKCKAGDIIDRHLTHTDIVFLIEGRYLLSHGSIIKKEINKGEVILLSPGSHVIAEVVEDSHYIVCRFRDVINLCNCLSFERLYHEVEITHPGFHTLHMNERIYSFVDHLVNCVNDGLKCTGYFNIKMKELFFMLRAYYKKEELARFLSPLLGKDARFMMLMYKNYRHVNSVQELAHLSNYSLSGFKKQFHRVFGTSASDWMREQKANLIFQDLNSSPLSIKELADKHGFSSPSAFSTFCQHKFGMPPGKLKLNVTKMITEQ